jgi:heparinase II/III-like protein
VHTIGQLIKKMRILGPKKTFIIAENKIRTKIFDLHWRRKALKKQARHLWEAIAYKHHMPTLFSPFFKILISRPMSLPGYLSLAMRLEDLCILADTYTNNQFDILGSGVQQFEKIPWHEDIRLKAHCPKADYLFPHNLFYKDIAITIGETKELAKDIKVPWELSRFQHLLVLGQAYEKTGHKRYAQTFVNHVEDWIIHNPYLLGPNWMCPMEVGLRAINWIVAFHYFRQEPTIPESFWQRFTESLYDHFFYLEHNWEIYDGRTSNHYLSDLVGYFYLCWFFQDLKSLQDKCDWCFAEILREGDKQVFSEGTSYEGSTTYHRLVTELFVHTFLLAQEQKMLIPPQFREKLRDMLHFINWCTPQGGDLVTLGDYDSGCVTYAGITKKMGDLVACKDQLGIKKFPEFGLSIIKTPAWHISLRHHAYQIYQPSGHFHNDAGSITLSLDGIPIIVDPGSYLYTPSRRWRNHFRSAAVHNTMFVEGHEPTEFDERLFALSLPATIIKQEGVDNEYTMYTSHELYQRLGLTYNRSIKLDHTKNAIHIVDSYACTTQERAPRFLIFNLTFGPTIQIKPTPEGFLVSHNHMPMAYIQTDAIPYEPYTACVSLAYGSIATTTGLRARIPYYEYGSYTISIVRWHS